MFCDCYDFVKCCERGLILGCFSYDVGVDLVECWDFLDLFFDLFKMC